MFRQLLAPTPRDEHQPARAVGENDWVNYCRAVGTAAEQLRLIALRAEMDAIAAQDSHDPLRSIAREVGLIGSRAPADIQTYGTMMLGPFAALEQLRRRIRS